jgi:hypothetical protein
MRAYRSIVTLWLCAIAAALPAEFAAAQSGGRKTLLQWSYGTSFSGGPDLSEPIVTDRPDFTEASSTVGYGVTQIEMGYTYTYDGAAAGSSRNHSFPETLLRLGTLADWFELRFDWNYGAERTAAFGGPVDTATGGEDLTIGCKIMLTPQEAILPESAIVLQASIPVGADEFTADEVLPGFLLLYGWDINEDWATGALTGVNRAIDDVTGDAYVELAQSWTVVRSWTDRLGSYAEWYVLAATSADTNHTENYFNGGFTYLLNDNVQWDIRAGVGLNEAADDFFVGSGLSVRFP